ncbi:hypothetical protein [Microvirga brassicacearum]|uniref:Uncharacterized protein n=1 Tax=Microvirga brassicacearum TaxID=2580413 RepID=A0A5N3PH30_9HYPH|nr:hypothetical protein [Microvirga brassicacearum]KAB0269044.1 hypothetical protein FEZ63_02750 [Microvirga brassicacearum]
MANLVVEPVAHGERALQESMGNGERGARRLGPIFENGDRFATHAKLYPKLLAVRDGAAAQH